MSRPRSRTLTSIAALAMSSVAMISLAPAGASPGDDVVVNGLNATEVADQLANSSDQLESLTGQVLAAQQSLEQAEAQLPGAQSELAAAQAAAAAAAQADAAAAAALAAAQAEVERTKAEIEAENQRPAVGRKRDWWCGALPDLIASAYRLSDSLTNHFPKAGHQENPLDGGGHVGHP